MRRCAHTPSHTSIQGIITQNSPTECSLAHLRNLTLLQITGICIAGSFPIRFDNVLLLKVKITKCVKEKRKMKERRLGPFNKIGQRKKKKRCSWVGVHS